MTITIVEYRPEWIAEFRNLAHGLRESLGGLAVRIDHIGSTAVPGLAAKDVIDVQIAVRSLDKTVAGAIARIGYVATPGPHVDHRPPGDTSPAEDWAKMFFRQADGARRVHIHVRVEGRANQRYALLFRDYLIAHPDVADAYSELKRRLAASLADAERDYATVKDPAVDLIYLPARAWAARGEWVMRPTDA